MGKYIEEREVTVYMCKACGALHAEAEEAEDHEKECIMNPENKSYATSKFLGVEKYPPTFKNAHQERSEQVANFLGRFHRPFDTRTGRYIEDEEFYKEAPDWEEAELNEEGMYQKPEETQTDEYKAFLERMDKAADANE